MASKDDHKERPPMSVGMQFGSVRLPNADRYMPEPVEVAIELLVEQKAEADRLMSESRGRVSAAVVAVRDLMVNAIGRDLIARIEISARQKGSSMYYVREFARCTEQEQDEVLSILQREKIIRVLDLGQIRNLRAKGNVIKVKAKGNGRFSDYRSPKAGPDWSSSQVTNYKPPVAKTMYLISNPEMPGWLKNGESTREPWQRANEMNTGAPSDYVVERSFPLPKGWSDKDFHPFMAKVAGASNREWFFMPLELAQQVIQLVIDGDGHLVDELPKAEPPSKCIALASNNLRAGLALSRKLKAKRREVLYDAAFLAFS